MTVARMLKLLQSYLSHSNFPGDVMFRRPALFLWQAALRWKGNLKGDSPQSLLDAARLLIHRPGLPADHPIFCFINLMGTHVPYAPPAWALDHCLAQPLRRLVTKPFLWFLNASLYSWLGPQSEELDSTRKALFNGLYDAEVAAQDRELGRFFHVLRRAGVLKRALLIVVADHGELLGEKRLLGHGYSAYHPLLHVPLIIHDPSAVFPRDTAVDTFVSPRRLFHTVVSAAGLATESERRLSLANETHYPVERGCALAIAEPLSRASLHVEARCPGLLRKLGYDRTQTAVYQGDFKLVTAERDVIALYEINTDPLEQKDLQNKMPGQVSRLLELGQQVWQQEGDTDTNEKRPVNELRVREWLTGLGYLE